MQIKSTELPNFGILEAKLDTRSLEQLFKEIENAKNNNINFNKKLAGNISSSLKIIDSKGVLNQLLTDLAKTYQNKYGPPYHSLNANKNYSINLDSLWVNFQKKGEFNPPHNHTGAYSFVIWMKIPTNYKEQKELAIAKNSSSDLKISNFSFLYNDISGKLREHIYPMSKNREGEILFFPSLLTHQVYPFYKDDNERISIAGNLGLIEVNN